MAWFVAGAAAVGFVGFANAVSPSRQESEQAALKMFKKELKDCTRNEQIAIDIAVGGPKMDDLRDKFQGLFTKPKGWSKEPHSFKFNEEEEKELGAWDQQQEEEKDPGYALYADSDVEAVYDVHQDTEVSGYEYEARWEDLRRLAPFDIDTDELKELGTYNIQEVLLQKQKVPQTFTLPRQLGGAATSANLLLNKLTSGSRAGFPIEYVDPGEHPYDKNYPPTDHPVEEFPTELRGRPAAAADWEYNRLVSGRSVRMPEMSESSTEIEEQAAAPPPPPPRQPAVSAKPAFLSSMFKRKKAVLSSSEYEDEDETEEDESSSS